jgi:hypothetical protein
MSRKKLSKSKIEAQERFMRKLSYLPLITTALALCAAGLHKCRENVQYNDDKDIMHHIDSKIDIMHNIEYGTCNNPGGLEMAKKAYKKSLDQKLWRKARLLRDVIAEMEYDRPSRDFQCEIMRNMREKRRSRNW